jgi:hypothetical protein
LSSFLCWVVPASECSCEVIGSVVEEEDGVDDGIGGIGTVEIGSCVESLSSFPLLLLLMMLLLSDSRSDVSVVGVVLSSLSLLGM